MPKTLFINYADARFRSKQIACLFTARLFSGFDCFKGYRPEDIDDSFRLKNQKILSSNRGAGYWLWKPYILNKALELVSEGDFIFYSDSACFILGSLLPFVSDSIALGQDVLAFQLPLIERQWTKKDLFLNLSLDDKKFSDSNQIMAGFILLRKSNFSRAFIEEFLELAQCEANLTDYRNPAITQDQDFIDHRHDQSIFSLLYKKYSLIPRLDPTQFGNLPCLYLENGYRNVLPEVGVLKRHGNRLIRVSEVLKKSDVIICLNRRSNLFKSVIWYFLFRFTRALD